VKKGQVFESLALALDSTSIFDPTGRVKRLIDMNAPSSQWRDGLFNIFEHGILHPMFLTSFLCTHGKQYFLVNASLVMIYFAYCD